MVLAKTYQHQGEVVIELYKAPNGNYYVTDGNETDGPYSAKEAKELYELADVKVAEFE